MVLTVNTFAFRELRRVEDFRAWFGLRARIYSATPGLCELDSLDPASGFDVDAWDAHSRHFGLFVRAGGQERLIGGLRVTGGGRSSHTDAMRGAIADAPLASARLDRPAEAPLPAMGYSVERSRIAKLVRDATARREPIVEAGRLVLGPEYRAHRLGAGANPTRFVVESAAALVWFASPVRHVLVVCRAAHQAFYSALGFDLLDGTSPHLEPALGESPYVALHGRARRLSPQARAKCEETARALRADGEIVLSVVGAPPRRESLTRSGGGTCPAFSTHTRFGN